MDPYVIRAELKKMEKRDLLGLREEEQERWCNVGGNSCSFFIRYKGFGFCLMELLGRGCSFKSEPGLIEDEPRSIVSKRAEGGDTLCHSNQISSR